jgi:hypothetical protein
LQDRGIWLAPAALATALGRPSVGHAALAGLHAWFPRARGHAARGAEMHVKPKQGPRTPAFGCRHAGSAAWRGERSRGPLL